MKVLIADDHPLVREALRLTVQRFDADAQVHEAADFETALALCETLAPDFALLDLNMPGMHALDGVRRLRVRFPAMAMIVASAQEDAATIRGALASGANGFFPKSSAPALLSRAIALVLAGEVYVPARALDGLHDTPMQGHGSAVGLTPRQRDVLRRLLHGHSNKLIARELGMSEGTVKIHIAAILRALGVSNRTEAVARAHELGLDSEPGAL